MAASNVAPPLDAGDSEARQRCRPQPHSQYAPDPVALNHAASHAKAGGVCLCVREVAGESCERASSFSPTMSQKRKQAGERIPSL